MFQNVSMKHKPQTMIYHTSVSMKLKHSQKQLFNCFNEGHNQQTDDAK